MMFRDVKIGRRFRHYGPREYEKLDESSIRDIESGHVHRNFGGWNVVELIAGKAGRDKEECTRSVAKDGRAGLFDLGEGSPTGMEARNGRGRKTSRKGTQG